MRRQIAGFAVVAIVAAGPQLAAQDSASVRPSGTTAARLHGRLVAAPGSGAAIAETDAYLWADTPELRTLFTAACTAARTSGPSWIGARTELAAPTGEALDSTAATDLATLRTLASQPHAATHVDSTGRFAFDGIPAGDYWVEAESTHGASIVQWWRHVSYAPADLAVARLMAGRAADDPLAVDLGARNMTQTEFCVDSVAADADASGERMSYRILPSGANGNQDTPPIAIETSAIPAFPPSLVDRHVQTKVVVTFTVRADGTVDETTITTSGGINSDVASTIRNAIRAWKFQPARRNGKSVAQQTQIEIDLNVTRG